MRRGQSYTRSRWASPLSVFASRAALPRFSSRPLLSSFPSLLSRCTISSNTELHPLLSNHSYATLHPGISVEASYVNNMVFTSRHPSLPIYRVMDEEGNVVGDSQLQVGKDEAQKMYKTMLTLNIMDAILYDAQRQGRISFYMTNFGEEATHIGSAAVLDPEDVIFAQYREAGVLLWRGFTIADFMNQCFSNVLDLGKGRQMPVHYGSRKLNFQTISSPLATQIPQAAGTGYALKMQGKKNISICYFGEGAASEGDFHPAMNFASTLGCPTVFFCRNNAYAISTPVKEQYGGDGIGGRGPSYGITTARVDGNDIWAVFNATKEARRIAIEEQRPVLIEAMTYRVGHHSTSDDSSAYRSKDEVQKWVKTNNPVTRMKLFMEKRGWWSDMVEEDFKKEIRNEVLTQLRLAEQQPKPPVEEMWTDVYHDIPPHLQEQKKELEEHMQKYPEYYTNVHKH
jgi:2-oxoisovalerate dehydrogenase E1 component alpha subunit